MRPTETADLLSEPDDFSDRAGSIIAGEGLSPEDLTEGSVARAILGYGLALGVAADALLRDGPTGIGLTIWVALAAVSMISATWRSERDIVPETRLWLATACCFAAFMSWRADEALQLLNLCAVAFALGMAAVVQSGVPVASLIVARVRDIVTSALRVARDVLAGAFPLLRSVSARSAAFGRVHDRRGPLLRATLLTLPVILIFGGLLRSADPIFASYTNADALDLGTVASHLVVIAIFTWLSAGWLSRPATVTDTEDPAARAESPLPLQIGTTEVRAVLGAPIVLLAAFVLAQLGWFFGGEEFLRQKTGLTVAEYARRGFFQMFWVTAFSIGLLVGTRAMLVADRSAHRLHTRLALPLLALVIAVVFSAVARLGLYVRYYGLTEDRFYAVTAIGWLTFVVFWLAATVLRDKGERFVVGAVGSGLAMLLALNVADPGAIIARTNLERPPVQTGTQTRTHDLLYLAGLPDGAVPLTVDATLRSTELPSATSTRCHAARTLLARWDAPDKTAHPWRAWNLGTSRANRAVQSRVTELREIARECPSRAASSRGD